MSIKSQGQSGFWKHGLLLTLLFGFTVMLVGGAYMYKTRAPIPEVVTGPQDRILFTAADIQTAICKDTPADLCVIVRNE